MNQRAPRRRLSVDARRAEILEVAVALTREVGLAGLTLSEIRDRAGVSAGLVSHYFSSLDGIRVAVFHEIFETEAPGNQRPPTARLADAIGAFASTDATANARAWVDALQLGRANEIMRQAVIARMVADREEMTDLIRQGCDAGEFRCEDPARSAQRILVVLDGYLMQFLIAEEREVRDALRGVVWDLAERELGVPVGSLRRVGAASLH